MAIFIASTKSISRGKGQSAVASASYRAGCELEDKRYGKTHDYSKKHGVMSADIILPTALASAKATIDRGTLWNKAESAENRKDARVAREWLVNLPYELSEKDRKELAHSFAQTLADRYSTIADCAIHQPTNKEIDRGADPRNFHAHIMFTTRTAELDDNNEILLTDKATIELSDKKRRSLGMERVSHEVKEVRQIWEQIANDKLAERNLNLIDSRSYAAQGIDIEPQLKMGSVATKLERDKYERELEKAKQAAEQGKVYEIDEIPATIRGEINAMIAERNALVLQASNRIIVEKRDFNERLERAERYIDRADQRIGFSKRWINSNSKRASRSEQGIEWARKRCENLPKRIDDTTQRIDFSERWITSNSKRVTGSEQLANRVSESIQKSDRQINSRTTRVSPSAPSPFDDNARRARATRLDRQQERVDRVTRANKYEDARLFESAKRVKLILSGKLLARNHANSRIRWESYETAEDYPDKYDKRQIEKLDNFAKSLGLEQNPHDYRTSMQEIASKFTGDFVERNKPIFELLNRPAAERERYNSVTKDFDDFKKYIDDKRTEFNASIVEKLGGSGGDVGRMTRDIISSFSYLKAIDAYIANDDRAEEAKEVSMLHRVATINKTCLQFKHALTDVHRLPLHEREKHTDALKTSLNVFTEQYSQELSKDQNTAIQSGISSYNYNQDRAVTQSRGLSR